MRDLRSGAVPLSWAHAKLIYDEPDQDKAGVPSGIEHGWIDDRPGGNRTQAELLIASPYFIPSEEGRRHLGEMRERGVRVAVLTDSLASTDSPAAHAGYARHRAALLRKGVELYELRPASGVRHPLSHRWRHTSPFSLHAKIIVQDRARAIVGSLNQDPALASAQHRRPGSSSRARSWRKTSPPCSRRAPRWYMRSRSRQATKAAKRSRGGRKRTESRCSTTSNR